MVARHGKMNTFMVAAFTIAASAAVAAVNATKTLTLPGGATMELIYVSPGTFMMGSPSSEAGRFDDETQHQVTLTKGFWLGKYEVTQLQREFPMRYGREGTLQRAAAGSCNRRGKALVRGTVPVRCGLDGQVFSGMSPGGRKTQEVCKNNSPS